MANNESIEIKIINVKIDTLDDKVDNLDDKVEKLDNNIKDGNYIHYATKLIKIRCWVRLIF